MLYRCFISLCALIVVQCASVSNSYKTFSEIRKNLLQDNVSFMKQPRRSERKIQLVQRPRNAIDELSENVVPYKNNGPTVEGPFNKDLAGRNIINVFANMYDMLSEKLENLQSQVAFVDRRTTRISDRLHHVDCYDLKINRPSTKSGVYTFYLDYKGKRPIKVHCDMMTRGGGWTIIQQRLPRNISNISSYTPFMKNFHEYQVGFGAPDNDYWIGLDNMYSLTSARPYELLVELGDFAGLKAFAHYSRFYVDEEANGFRLHIGGYSGNAGDSLSTDLEYDNFTADGMFFSSHDRDRDTSVEINCSNFWDIGGWWFNRCSWANLNGPYRFPPPPRDEVKPRDDDEEKKEEEACIGINWHKWRNKQCLKSTRMMIRPVRQP